MKDNFDNIKNVWKSISESESQKEYSVEDIKKIVKKRSNNELTKIRRKLIGELSITLILSLFLVLFVFFVTPANTKYALILVVLILVISFIPYSNVIRAKASNHSNLKKYLSDFIFRFEKLIKQYTVMSIFLIPLAVLGGFLLGHYARINQQTQSESFFTLTNLGLTALLLALVSLAGFWFVRRYFKLLYGKNIQRLRNCLSDLEEAE